MQDPSRRQTAARDAVIVALVLVCGLYLPTSIAANGSKLLVGIGFVLCPVLLGLLAATGSARLATFPVCVGIFSSIPLLIFFTSFSTLPDQSMGYLAAFFSMSCLYVMDLREVRWSRWLTRLFIAANLINIIIGISILAHVNSVDDFLISHYSQFYPELVPGMLAWRKPVISFGTHSLAGFFLYLFFYLNLQTHKVRGKKIFLALALCYLVLLLGLLSVTGVVLALIGILQVFWYFWSSFRFKWFTASAVVVVVLLLISVGPRWLSTLSQSAVDTADAGQKILTSPGNGLIGRFTPSGTMYASLVYIRDHPFGPIGVSGVSDLTIADSGFVDYWLRGSFFLVAWAYGGLFLLLKRSLLDKRDLSFLFIVILAFEVGFSSLVYFRMSYILAFAIIYLNSLRRADTPAYAAARMAQVTA